MSLHRAIVVTPDNDLRQSVRDALPAHVISADFFTSAEECIAADAWKETELLVTDLRLPAMSGIGLIEQARKSARRFDAVLVVGESNAAQIIHAYELGVTCVLAKPISHEILRQLTFDAIARFPEAGRHQHLKAQGLKVLTSREREVLQLLLADLSTRQIARRLLISPSTVEKHRAKILSKLRVKSVVGLAVRYFQAQLGGPTGPHFKLARPEQS